MSSLFGLDQSDRLVFVSEAPRGLACHCRCVVCNEPLIARQGTVRDHHFAHASGTDPCCANHESLLHRYAKRLIQAAGHVTVPINAPVANALGLDHSSDGVHHLALINVEVEKALLHIRPDLVADTPQGVVVAIEIAYSSFCDMLKIDQFSLLNLPALEIDLRSFTPEAFDPEGVRQAVLHSLATKTWLWPLPVSDEQAPPTLPPATAAAAQTAKARLPEEIVEISGRWVSIKEFASGDISVRVITYDPDVVSMVRTIAKANHARYAPKWKSWNVPRWRAEAVRQELRARSKSVAIVMTSKP